MFGDPKSTAYAMAQSKKDLFEGISVGVGNWQDLVAAYKAAGITVGAPWEFYLQNLGPENIFAIAQARLDGLTRGVAMKVRTHANGGAHKVNVSHEADGSIMVDLPF